MSKRLTDEELQAIRERVEKATEGPWRIGKQSPNGLNNIGTVGGLLTAQTTNEANAVFIAHARQDIPKLLAEIERLRDKQIKKEITETIPGGGKCPSCDVRLIGKANYCGKCGQRIGWQVYGGNIYDNNGGDDE